ncbi:serine/threonine-protein kinase 52-like [Carex rostrata]
MDLNKSGENVNLRRSMSGKGVFTRADTFNLKDLDIQLEKKLSKVLIKEISASFSRNKHKPEEWEIDVSKLDIRYVIAKGTYGTVFRGTYDGKDIAVKLLDWGSEEVVTDAETAERRSSFYKEVTVWHKLNHPNVTQFVGASMVPSDLRLPSDKGKAEYGAISTRAVCVVLEFLSGGTLKQYLIKNRAKRLPFDVFLRLALDLARGLEYLHSQRIVHRDVKTENMLLDNEKNLKIADFGVARVEARNPQEMTGETGTLGYMAPEVLDGKPYNRKCDVYSFSICLWEMYCCKMPYQDVRSFGELMTGVVRQGLRPKIPRHCPSKLARIMKRCWDGIPDNRPEMQEVVQKLEEIRAAVTGQSPPVCSMFCFA